MRGVALWPIALGVGVGAALLAAGTGVGAAVGVGVALAAAVTVTRRRTVDDSRARSRIDPFTVGEPWRRQVQGALRAADRAHRTVERVDPGPLRDRLDTIVVRLDDGVEETWRIARRGDEIDGAVTSLDPTGLRSKLTTLRARHASDPGDDLETAIESVESQLATVDRLKARSAATADSLRLATTRLEELVSRASEIAIGAGDTDAYEHDVDDLVIELEALRQAIQEVQPE